MTQVNISDQTQWYIPEFLKFESGLNGSAGSDFHQYRKQAFEALGEKGFPGSKDEDWKYTDPRAITSGSFSLKQENSTLPTKADIEEVLSGDINGPKAVFVDGRYVPELSELQPETGLAVQSIREVLKTSGSDHDSLLATLSNISQREWNAFRALNTMFLEDGLLVTVDAEAQIEKPLQIVFWSSGEEKRASFPLLFVQAGSNSKFQLIETYAGNSDKEYFTGSYADFDLEEGASVDHYRLGFEGSEACHVGLIDAFLRSNCNFRTHVFNSGGKLVRNEICPVLDGEEIDCTMNGLTVAGDNQHVDNHTVLDHRKPHCESHEHFKGIYSDQAKGVFNGTIIVRPDAQKTNAFQSNQAILLSDRASSRSKPQLKIWADDVKCSHGATIGELDEEALFYLRSRGIQREAAQRMLLKAFAGEILDEVKNDKLRSFLESRMGV